MPSKSIISQQQCASWRMLAAIGILLFGIGFFMIATVQVVKFYDPERRQREKDGLAIVKKWLGGGGGGGGHSHGYSEADAKYFKRVPIPEDKPRLEFYFKAGCGGCEGFKPVWKEFVDKYPPAQFMAIDPIDTDKVDCRNSGITLVPTVAFRAHAKADLVKYTGPPVARDIYKWAKAQLRKSCK